MKTITIKQPWASLIVEGIKDVENRTWKTNFRGRVLVHASAKPANIKCEIEGQASVKEIQMFSALGRAEEDDLFGCIIGSVEIVDCVINHPSIWAEKSITNFGNICKKNNCPEFIEWSFGEGLCESCKLVGQSYYVNELPLKCLHKDKMPKPTYNWVLANPIKFPESIPCKGKLSFWDYPNIISEPGEKDGNYSLY